MEQFIPGHAKWLIGETLGVRLGTRAAAISPGANGRSLAREAAFSTMGNRWGQPPGGDLGVMPLQQVMFAALRSARGVNCVAAYSAA